MATAAGATTRLHALGQSLWLDNITRGLLTSGTLRRYIDEWSVTGLTSNPTIFDHAIENSHFYDDAIRQKSGEGTIGEALFFELALEDLSNAAALFRPVHDATTGAGRVGVARSLAAAGQRYGRHDQGGGSSPRASEALESPDQDSRHA